MHTTSVAEVPMQCITFICHLIGTSELERQPNNLSILALVPCPLAIQNILFALIPFPKLLEILLKGIGHLAHFQNIT